ncbi:MAG TPA: thermonuclease family protein [Solirubrobacteraceae bacterium]|nr:thermonuclease family protein [Solirubrobacteraceae bacterium]
MPSLRTVLPIAIVVALLAAAAAQLRRDDDSDGVVSGAVVRVIDGDTITVRVGGRVERVRYIGVDTPESVKPDTPVQCFAEAAHAFNARLVAKRRVRLVTDAERRDRYGRLLAYVYRDDDGLLVNAELVRRGYAQTLTIPPNVRFASRFRTLARRARAAGTGLWGAC